MFTEMINNNTQSLYLFNQISCCTNVMFFNSVCMAVCLSIHKRGLFVKYPATWHVGEGGGTVMNTRFFFLHGRPDLFKSGQLACNGRLSSIQYYHLSNKFILWPEQIVFIHGHIDLPYKGMYWKKSLPPWFIHAITVPQQTVPAGHIHRETLLSFIALHHDMKNVLTWGNRNQSLLGSRVEVVEIKPGHTGCPSFFTC